MSDEDLVRSLPGDFRNEYAEVNGTRLHYVIGGEGTPLVLLPGWPRTWWEFHKVMPSLAERHRVIAVDIRGMGGSAKSESGYDKKNMALDIRELAHHLGYDKIDIAGSDIGAMVAYSFAANHPDSVGKVALLDVAHPSEQFERFTLVPGPGQQINPWDADGAKFLWWFAFNQVKDLPERLLAGRMRYLIDWLIDYHTTDPGVISDQDRAIYADAYSQPDAIRAGNGWYQAFGQDIADERTYGKLTPPILALGGVGNYGHLRDLLPEKAIDVRVLPVDNSGHYIPEEQPEATLDLLTEFFGPPRAS
jgi:pimeloyl-ACP methyl ester carboxylesterase